MAAPSPIKKRASPLLARFDVRSSARYPWGSERVGTHRAPEHFEEGVILPGTPASSSFSGAEVVPDDGHHRA